METENKRIPFDWDKYKSGEYQVVCRDGRKDIIIGAYNPNAKEHKLAAWVESELYCYTGNGLINKERGFTTLIDLFLIPKSKQFQAWVNLYSDGLSSSYRSEYMAKELVDVHLENGREFIETRLIEWEG
jgi:hypothetical protein